VCEYREGRATEASIPSFPRSRGEGDEGGKKGAANPLKKEIQKETLSICSYLVKG